MLKFDTAQKLNIINACVILSCKLSGQDIKKLVAFLKVCGFTLKHMVRDMKRIYSQIYGAGSY